MPARDNPSEEVPITGSDSSEQKPSGEVPATGPKRKKDAESEPGTDNRDKKKKKSSTSSESVAETDEGTDDPEDDSSSDSDADDDFNLDDFELPDKGGLKLFGFNISNTLSKLMGRFTNVFVSIFPFLIWQHLNYSEKKVYECFENDLETCTHCLDVA